MGVLSKGPWLLQQTFFTLNSLHLTNVYYNYVSVHTPGRHTTETRPK